MIHVGAKTVLVCALALAFVAGSGGAPAAGASGETVETAGHGGSEAVVQESGKPGGAAATTDEAGDAAVSGHSENERDRQAAHGERKAAMEPPPAYYLQWLAIFSILAFGSFFAWRLKTNGGRYEGKGLTYVLTTLAVLAFVLKYDPGLEAFEEDPVLGMAMVFVLIADGVLLTLYGILGRHDDHEDDGTEHEAVGGNEA